MGKGIFRYAMGAGWLFALAFGGVAAETSRCAVLAFEAAPGVTIEQADQVADRFAIELAKQNSVVVLNRSQIVPVLLRASFNAAAHPSPEAAARAAGELLGVDQVVLGTVSVDGGKKILLTRLLNVRTSGIIRGVRTTSAAKFERFLELVPGDNAEKLMDADTVSAPVAPLATTPVVATPPSPASDAKEEPWYDKQINWEEVGETTLGVLRDRVEVGTRMTYFMLLNSQAKDRFVGHVDELDAQQDYSLVEEYFWLPANWFVSYKITPEWGVDVAWNKLSADARNDIGDVPDGAFMLSGPILSGCWRYLNDSRWTPYAGAGLAWYQGDFHHERWWANGYDSPADYEALGPEPRKGKTRSMSLHDTWGYVIYGGADTRLWKSLFADATVRFVHVDGDVSFTGQRNGRTIFTRGSYTVPFSHFAFGLGLKWEF